MKQAIGYTLLIVGTFALVGYLAVTLVTDYPLRRAFSNSRGFRHGCYWRNCITGLPLQSCLAARLLA